MSKSTAEKQTTLKYILLLGSQDVIFSLLKITSSHSTGSKNCMLLTDKIMTDNRKNDIFPVYTYNQECKFDFYEGAFSFQKTNQWNMFKNKWEDPYYQDFLLFNAIIAGMLDIIQII